ncbi:interleukin-12 subunit beta [Eucyclogobius newberryi]|uniref:interleukin-12 subunit beta n=1 Tax=Eucyclogobius newberryi TaxID=166745 RepID=UPI003B5BF65E
MFEYKSAFHKQGWIITLLLCASAAVHGLNHFPEKLTLFSIFLDVTAKKNAILTCEIRDKLVTWKLNDHVLSDGDFGGNIRLNGPSVTVKEVDTPVLGEYACWSAGRKISSTFLLLEVENDGYHEDLICRAKSYNCFFTCIWHNSGHNVARLRLGRDCDNKTCQWVNGEEADGSFHFNLSHSLSPFAEESSMLELTVEALDNFFILKRTKMFYLRDIVKPDSPNVVGCESVGTKQRRVTVEPPNSWSSPHSFFSLENEFEYILKDNGEIIKSSSALIPRRISKFRVRCRDSYARSAWSDWTAWKNVTF